MEACGIQRRKRTVPATTRRQEGKSNTLSRRAPCGAEPDAGRTERWKHRCVLLYGVHESISGKKMDCVIIYNPKNGRFKEGIIATPELGTAFSMEMKDLHMAVPLPVLAGQNTGEKLVALLAYASIEAYGPLFDAEFHYYYQQLKAMHDNGWIFEEAAKKEFGTEGHSSVYGY